MSFQLKPVEKMPRRSTGTLSDAVRNLDGTKAIFIGVDGDLTLETVRARASSVAYPLNAKVRTDREANGVWIYRSA